MLAQVIAPIITLVLGWVLSETASWLRDRRQEKVKKLEREQQKADARAAFQRQTLLDLHEGLFQLVRATGRINHEDTMAYRLTGEWGRNRITDEWDKLNYEAMVRTNILGVRVADETLREQMNRMRQLCSEVAVSPTPERSEKALKESMELFDKINERIGELLRSTY